MSLFNKTLSKKDEEETNEIIFNMLAIISCHNPDMTLKQFRYYLSTLLEKDEKWKAEAERNKMCCIYKHKWRVYIDDC